MKKIMIIGLMLLVSFMTLHSCQETNTLVVGLECDYVPFNWILSSKTPTSVKVSNISGNFYADGYDIQIAKKLAAELGKKLVVKQISWEGLIPALLNKEIDVIIAGMSPTAERKEVISFTEKYYTSNHVVLLQSNSPFAGAEELSALSGARGVAQLSTIYADIVSRLSVNGVVVLPEQNTVPTIITMIKSGEADFTVVEYPVAKGLIYTNPEFIAIFTNPDINYFDVDDEDRDIAIGVRKEDTELLAALNVALSHISTADRIALMDECIAKTR